MKKPFLLTLCFITFVLSCVQEKEEFDKEEVREGEINQEIEGSYETFLVPVNTEIAGSTVGNFRKNDRDLWDKRK